MNNKIMKKRRTLAAVLVISLLCMTGCGAANGTPDDVATNDGGSQTESETGSGGISKDNIKVGVLYISDPSEGSGYSYTHDLGVKGMQSNLGLKEDQIERKIVDDSDAVATQEAIEACISDGCNIIFTTSWGYMDTTEKMAEKYPEVYFSHGTGYKSNGKNFTNYFGRIYQARYLSGIVAGMNTKSGKIGYVAAQDSSNSEVTGGITVYADRSFSFITKTPPAAVLLKKACKIKSGSATPNKTKVASISKEDLQKIAELKMPDLNAASLEAAMSMIAGTARSMGITVAE